MGEDVGPRPREQRALHEHGPARRAERQEADGDLAGAEQQEDGHEVHGDREPEASRVTPGARHPAMDDHAAGAQQEDQTCHDHGQPNTAGWAHEQRADRFLVGDDQDQQHGHLEDVERDQERDVGAGNPARGSALGHDGTLDAERRSFRRHPIDGAGHMELR